MRSLILQAQLRTNLLGDLFRDARRDLPRRLAGLALAATLLAAPMALAINSRARRIGDARWGITLEAPPGWTISQRTGFAETLFLLLFPDGSRISLSAERTRVPSTAMLVSQNREALSKQRFVVVGSAEGPGPWRSIDLEAPGRAEKLRQLYQVRTLAQENQALVLTLITPANSFATQTAALAFVVERMAIEAPAAEGPADSSGAGTNASGLRPGVDARHGDAAVEDPRQP